MAVIIGIDPGLSGAIAELDSGVILVSDMPTFAVKRGNKTRRFVDPVRLAAILRILYSPDHIILEEVASMPKQGVASTFSFGRAFGIVEGVIGALGIPVTYVRPAVWKREMKLTADKGQSQLLATHLFPKDAGQWPLKKHDGRAEAALLAEYGRRILI